MKRMRRLLLIGYLIVILWQLAPVQVYAEEELSKPITAWPLIYHRAGHDQAETDILWPILRYEREKSWTRYAIRPLLFSTEGNPEKDYRRTSILWPLSTYNHKGPELSFYVFPVYWYGRTPGSHYNIFFPVYWDGEGKGYSYFHLWPLFGINRSGEGFSEYSTIYPFFRYGHDSLSGEIDLHILWPIFNLHMKGDYLSHRLLPLYWYERGPDISGGFVFPYYWRKTPESTSRGIFPIWYSSHGAEITTDLVFPIYFNRETPSEHLRLVTPLYISRSTEEGSLSTLIPVYLKYERQDFGLRIGLPVYLHYRSGPFAFSSFFPFYYHSEDAKLQTKLTYYFPIYGSYQRGEAVSRHFLLFPLYSKLTDEGLHLDAWDIAWPLFHYESSPSSFSVRALPFYWHTRTPEYGLTIGFPLYWSFTSGEDSYWHLLPLYGVHKKGDWYEKHFILGPVFMDTRDTHTNLTRQDILFPIFSRMQEGEKERSWLIPIYYHQSDSKSLLTLGSLALLPPYYIHRQEPGEGLFHVWPLYSYSRQGSYKEYGTLWPLIRFGSNPDKNIRMSQLLLFYQKISGENSLTTLFPIWWHKKTPQTTIDSSLFLYWYGQEIKKETTKISLLWLPFPDLKHPLENRPGISLIRYERTPQRLKHAVFPLYSYEKKQQTDSLKFSLLWPIFSYSSRGEFVEQTGFLWKFITYERKDDTSSDFRFLWRFIRSSKTKDSSVFEFNPFYYQESEEGKGSYWAILGGLIGQEVTVEGGREMRWLWIF